MKRSDFSASQSDEGTEPEREEAARLGALLRKHTAPAARDFEGFNAGVLGRLAAETPAVLPKANIVPIASLMPLRRLVWGGFGGLAAAAALFLALVRPALEQPGPPPEYYAQVLKSTTSDPAISAVAVHSQQDGVTVLWIDGLDYIPAQKAKN